MRVRATIALVAALGAFAPGPATSAIHYLPATPGPEGMVFPVARTAHYRLINFHDDWLAPRMRRVEGRWQQVGVHEGNDIFAEPGTPVLSVTSGTVERVGWTFYSGWRVGVRDEAGRYWFYAHLSAYAPGIGPGARVVPGSKLGEVGNTGYGATPGHDGEFTHHLHIGIQQPDGTWSDPFPLMKRLYRAAVGDARWN